MSNASAGPAGAGVLIKEYAEDPFEPARPGQKPILKGLASLAEQHVGVGPAPSESANFTQQTQFVTLTFAANMPHNPSMKGCAIHYHVGLDPIPALTTKWREKTLSDGIVPQGEDARLALPVGRGSRIAFLGLGFGHQP